MITVILDIVSLSSLSILHSLIISVITASLTSCLLSSPSVSLSSLPVSHHVSCNHCQSLIVSCHHCQSLCHHCQSHIMSLVITVSLSSSLVITVSLTSSLCNPCQSLIVSLVITVSLSVISA